MYWTDLLYIDDFSELRDEINAYEKRLSRKNFEDAIVVELKGRARPKVMELLRAAERRRHYDEFMRNGLIVVPLDDEERPRIKGEFVLPVICRKGTMLLDY